MREHYTSNTVSAEKWCRVCKRKTQHRVDSHQITRVCLDCQERDEEERAARAGRARLEEPKVVQELLFA